MARITQRFAGLMNDQAEVWIEFEDQSPWTLYAILWRNTSGKPAILIVYQNNVEVHRIDLSPFTNNQQRIPVNEQGVMDPDNPSSYSMAVQI